ncbi:unnamed protein product [Phaeothamnion confervicola]
MLCGRASSSRTTFTICADLLLKEKEVTILPYSRFPAPHRNNLLLFLSFLLTDRRRCSRRRQSRNGRRRSRCSKPSCLRWLSLPDPRRSRRK